MADGRMRLDRWLAEHGYATTRSRAQWLIESGQIWVDGQPRRKPSLAIADGCQVEVRGDGWRYVSRGGFKLERALHAFGVDVTGVVAFDIGASTGGFTDCLLQHGAQRVYALDVGAGQLASGLRHDSRVMSLEGRNIRDFRASDLPETVDLITVDVSFISLTLILPLLPPFLRRHGHVIALVKPQFEVGMGSIGRAGVVRDTAHRTLAIGRVLNVAEEAGFQMVQTADAPRFHKRGNHEVFIFLSCPPVSRVNSWGPM